MMDQAKEKTQKCEERYGTYGGIVEEKMFYLYFLKAKPFLEAYDFIPEDQLQIKLGCNHRQSSMKFAYQLANLEKLNLSKKPVVLHIKSQGHSQQHKDSP